MDRAAAVLAEQPSRAIILLTASDDRPDAQPEPARSALAKVMGLAPKSWRPDRETMFLTAERLLDADPQAGALWLSDGVTTQSEQARLSTFLSGYGNRVNILSPLDKSPSQSQA